MHLPMTPDQSNTALTILDYWQAIEALSPGAPPKNDRKDHVWTAGDETTLPWHERMRATYVETRERRWRFLVHIGLFEMEGVVLELRDRLGVDDDEERPRGGEAALVCLCVTADGHPFGAPAVSAVPWAMNEIAAARGELRFGDFGVVEERVVTRITDYLAEREILVPEEGNDAFSDAQPLTLADCDAIAAIVAKETGWTPRAGLTARARFKGVELKSRKDGRFGEIEPDLLNSFFLRDLGRVSDAIRRGDYGPGLVRYLFGHSGGRTDVVRDAGFAERLLHPSNLPSGCWPTPGGHPLVMAQQTAVNAALETLKDGRGVFSVNGPPGTGKTTLLRDLIVGVIVERAMVLAQFTQPNDAFDEKRAIRHSDYHVWEIDERLRGFEMVVASSNNSAVENVTREVPALKAIDPRWLDQADHFRAAADTLFAPDGNPGKAGTCWGMMAAVLGNKEKRSTFVNRFWFGRFDRVKVPPTLFKNAFQEGAPSWHEARAAFRQAIARFEDRRDALAALSDALTEHDEALSALSAAEDAVRRDEASEQQRTLEAAAAREDLAKLSAWGEILDRCQEASARERSCRDALNRLDNLMAVSRQSEVLLVTDLAEAEAAIAACEARLAVEREVYERLDRERPSFFSTLFGTKHQRDWQARRREAGDIVTRLQRERVEADLRRSKAHTALEVLERERAAAPADRDKLLMDRDTARRTLAELLRSDAGLTEPALLQEVGDWQGVGDALHTLASTATATSRTVKEEARRRMVAVEEARRQLAASQALWESQRTASAALADRLDALGGGFAGTLIDVSWRALSEEERQKTSPWMDRELHDLRVACFLRALDLHRAFLAGASKKVWTNLNRFMDLLTGKIAGDAVEGGPASLWATFGLAVPLVSTTFASFDRLFDGMGRESIGWLFVDEAGQATPQAATGAVWRARRAVIIGDPLQLEPVVTLPMQAVEAIRRRCALADRWHPVRASAQVLADRANPLGTALPQEDGDPLWVGSPLRVHRRCLDPMFSVANRIAYDGLMVQGRVGTPDPGGLFGESRWIDIPAEGAEGHLIPIQRDLACALVTAAWHEAKRVDRRPGLYVISPFRKVAQGLRERLERDGWDPNWIKEAVGTVHTFQGKEAELVLLVLGGNPAKPGGMDWAALTPNLLNVALTRARDRILVIGDRDRWKTRRYFDALANGLPVVDEASIRAETNGIRFVTSQEEEFAEG
ncbi:superfamily I DNA and RNA helicase (plasmid) [Azospirillum sp. B510]|nr:superfamily I DNA and RNA helicase [Azospirillum sp. B510]